MIQCPGWGMREISLFGSLPYSWEGRVLTHTLLLFLVEKTWAKKVSLGPKTVFPWRKGNVGKVRLLLLSSLMHPISYSLLQWCGGTSSLEAWTSTRVLLSVSDCLRHCFPEVPWKREELELVHRQLQGPQMGLSSVSLNFKSYKVENTKNSQDSVGEEHEEYILSLVRGTEPNSGKKKKVYEYIEQ